MHEVQGLFYKTDVSGLNAKFAEGKNMWAESGWPNREGEVWERCSPWATARYGGGGGRPLGGRMGLRETRPRREEAWHGQRARASGKKRKANAAATGGLRREDDGRWRARDQVTTGMGRSGPWALDLAG